MTADLTGNPTESSERDIVKTICKSFSENGYSCKINYPLDIRGTKLILDVFCQKGEEKVIVEVKIGTSISERDVQQLVSYSRFMPNAKWYLCIPSSTPLQDSLATMLQQSNIGLMFFKDGRITFETRAVSYAELRKDWKNAYDRILRGYLEKYPGAVPGPKPPEEVPTFWRSGRGRYQHRITPDEIEAVYYNTLLGYQQKLSQVEAILDTSTPIKLRIATELLDQISQLKNISYARELANFEKKYRNAKSFESEYQIVLETLKRLWETYEKEKGAAAFRVYKDFEPLLKQISWYRDHMIHPFQVFLMGSIIIDRYYQVFQNAYKTRLQNSRDGDLDFAWLLCSTFHDFCYPIQMYEFVNQEMFKKFLQVKKTSILPRLQTERILVQKGQLRLMDQLISLLCHCTNKTKDNTWIFDSKCKIDDELRFVFLKEMTEKKNHAPLSALTLLNMILSERVTATRAGYIEETFSTAVYPAGLAIAIHDPDILESLPQKFNVLFDTMPIAFLLIYCDIAQEFGRSEHKEYCTLKSINLESNLVETNLAFSKKSAYKKKAKEIDHVMGRLKSNAIEFKIHVAFAEEEYAKASAHTAKGHPIGVSANGR